MIIYRCDVCGQESFLRAAMHKLRIYKTGIPSANKRRSIATSNSVDVCGRCANALTARLYERGTAPRTGGNRAHCVQCGVAARTHLRLFQRGAERDGQIPKDYTHTGALCPRHAQPFLAIPDNREEAA